jgi:succinyl-diaminopimelate desuccinylase
MEEILRKLVAFRTVADDAQSTHQALDYIATFVTQRGMHVARFESKGHESLVATVVAGNKTPKVLLAAHLDVVPAPDELFDIRIADGKIYGRGTLDMKYAVAAYLQLIDELQDDLARYDIGLMITTDEEVGGNEGTGQLVKEGYKPSVCVIPDGGDNWQIQIASKGFYYLHLQAYGTPAHGSRPWHGVNAILPMIEALGDIQALFGESKPENSTLNIGKLGGGGAVNQVADYAEASIDIRAHTETEKRALLARVQAICATRNVELTVALDGVATQFSLDDPLIAPFARHITAVTGTQVTGSHTLGSNDTRFFAEQGVPCISLYPTGAGHHGPDEWVSEEGFYQFKEVLGRYLNEVARTND